MTINDIRARGGADTACGTGQARITSLSVQVSLTQSSIDWIMGELARRYINVTIKDTYPKFPEVPDTGHPYRLCTGLQGLNTPSAELDCQFFRPLDPGDYSVTVTACQSDGKCTTRTLPNPVKVYLLETRLTLPDAP